MFHDVSKTSQNVPRPPKPNPNPFSMTKINIIDSRHMDDDVAAYVDDDRTVAAYVAAYIDNSVSASVDDDVAATWMMASPHFQPTTHKKI